MKCENCLQLHRLMAFEEENKELKTKLEDSEKLVNQWVDNHRNKHCKWIYATREIAALKKHAAELEELSAMECKFKRVKVDGFAWHCADCKEKFDITGDKATCPYCKSIKIRMTQ